MHYISMHQTHPWNHQHKLLSIQKIGNIISIVVSTESTEATSLQYYALQFNACISVRKFMNMHDDCMFKTHPWYHHSPQFHVVHGRTPMLRCLEQKETRASVLCDSCCGNGRAQVQRVKCTLVFSHTHINGAMPGTSVFLRGE